MQFPVNLSIFKGENYERWVAQMNVIFRFQDVAEIVNDGVPTLEAEVNDVRNDEHKEQRKKVGKGLFLIHQCVNPNVFKKIIKEESAKGA